MLKNKKIYKPKTDKDVVTCIRHVLRGFRVEKQVLDDTRFYLHFYQKYLGPERADGTNEIYFGGAQIVLWSDSTEIVKMWAEAPEETFNKQKVWKERWERLEEWEIEILEMLEEPALENSAAKVGPVEASLPAIEDPMNQRVWKILQEDLSMSDTMLGINAGIGRQNANRRRNFIAGLGYKVREPKPKKKKVSRQKQ